MRLEHGVKAVDRNGVHGLSGVDHVSNAGQIQLRLRLKRQELAGRQAVGEIGCLKTPRKIPTSTQTPTTRRVKKQISQGTNRRFTG